jgi:hypothetical protein
MSTDQETRKLNSIKKMLDLMDQKAGQARSGPEEEARVRKIMEFVRQSEKYTAPRVERVCGKFVEGRIKGQFMGGWPSVAQFGAALTNESVEPGDYEGVSRQTRREDQSILENPAKVYRPEIETKHEEWRRKGREYINSIMKDWDEEHGWITTTDKALRAKLLSLRMIEFRKRTGVGNW